MPQCSSSRQDVPTKDCRTVTEAANHFLIGFSPATQGGIRTVNLMTREVIGPRGLAIVVLLHGYAVKLSSEDLCLYL